MVLFSGWSFSTLLMGNVSVTVYICRPAAWSHRVQSVAEVLPTFLFNEFQGSSND